MIICGLEESVLADRLSPLQTWLMQPYTNRTHTNNSLNPPNPTALTKRRGTKGLKLSNNNTAKTTANLPVKTIDSNVQRNVANTTVEL